ncbi:hypothetical protein Dimus_006105, partial [Dionaea muscipula]
LVVVFSSTGGRRHLQESGEPNKSKDGSRFESLKSCGLFGVTVLDGCGLEETNDDGQWQIGLDWNLELWFVLLLACLDIASTILRYVLATILC